MNISEAVSERILELCKLNGITVNKLSTISGVTQSTVNDIVNRRAKKHRHCNYQETLRWSEYFNNRFF